MPLPSSGTINLSDVIEEFGVGTNNSVNLITTASTGTVTAPVTGFVVVEVAGAGGGGGGSTSAPYVGGGGGSGAWAKELIFIESGQTLNYYCGLGGAFGEGPGGPIPGSQGDDSYVYSGTKTITTIKAGGGTGGITASGSPGTAGGGGSNTNANTNIGHDYVGNGGLDGDDGIDPGGGGILPVSIPGATNAGNGGDGGGAPGSGNGVAGNNGAIKFTWYETTKNLRGYLKSANTNVPDFTKNSTVPTSGTMELRDFLGGSAVGFKADAIDVISNSGTNGLSNEAWAKFIIRGTGRYDLDGGIIVGSGPGYGVTEALNQQWATANGIGGFEPRRFYVAFFKTQGIEDFTPSSSAVNTWITLAGGDPEWNLYAISTDKYIEGNLCISTTNSNTGIVANTTVGLEVLAAGSN